MNDEKVKKYRELEMEKIENDDDLRKINSFLDRDANNRDTAEATHKKGFIFVKFAGTGCYLPIDIFNAELLKRKQSLESRQGDIEKEKSAL